MKKTNKYKSLLNLKEENNIFSQDLELGENFEPGLPKIKIDQKVVELTPIKKQNKKCQSKKLI